MILETTSLLAFEAAVCGAASLAHAGVLIDGYEHGRAAIAEAIIAAVLLAGTAACLLHHSASRPIALAVQAFALLGTLVGAFTIVIGVGPQASVEYLLHLFMLALLLAGLVVVDRRRPG